MPDSISQNCDNASLRLYINTPPECKFFSGANAATAEDVEPGSFIRFFSQGQSRGEALVLRIRDRWMNILPLSGPRRDLGQADTVFLADKGLEPYSHSDVGNQVWNRANHTEVLDGSMPIYFSSAEEAQGILKVVDGFNDLENRFGIVSERSLESLALEALVKYALEPRNTTLERLGAIDLLTD